MRKLSLNLDDLSVQSFVPAGPSARIVAPETDAGCLISGICVPTEGGGSTCDGAYTCGVCAYTGQPSCDYIDCSPSVDIPCEP